MIQFYRKLPFLSMKSKNRRSEYARRLHSHPEVSLGFIKSGDTTISILGQKYNLTPGDFVLIPAETAHLCIPHREEQFEFLMFYIDPDWWEKNLHFPSKNFYIYAAPSSADMIELFERIEADDCHVQETEVLEGLKRITEGRLEVKDVPEGKDDLDSVHVRIRDLPEVNSRIDQMAAQINRSKFSFIRQYARRYGLTPHADQINMRIQRAILLFETDRSLADIALDCGFSDQSHFIRQFKLYSGMKPQDYREAILSNTPNPD